MRSILHPSQPSSELEVTLMPGEVIQTDGSRLFRTRVNGTDEQYVNPRAQEDGMPGYAVQWMEVEGPLADASIGAGYRLLFGDLPMKRVEPGQPGVALDVASVRRGRRWRGGGVGSRRTAAGPAVEEWRRAGPRGRGFRGGRGGARLAQATVEVVSENPRDDGERLLRAFMKRAYRRPVEEAHVQRMLALFNDQLDKGFGFAKSLLSTYTAVFTSPAFVFVQEQPGRLDDYALATRLSLFLWNSEPDAELRELAASGQLHEPDMLRAQAERLLDDPKSKRFVEAFTDYWLDLRKIDDTSPSSTLYNDYDLDDPLKQAALEETRLFVEELLRKDLPARNVVDSDFTFLNERLATHYGISGVSGAKMRRVAFAGGFRSRRPDDAGQHFEDHGQRHDHVARAARSLDHRAHSWAMETPPPPPVPAIEPDIRGAVTIRQQLERHRADPTCARCHTQNGPAGFALESFDVMGGWRDRYRAVSDDVKPEPGVGMNGQRFAFHYALPVDCSGQLPDGRAFADVRQLKKMLLRG